MRWEEKGKRPLYYLPYAKSLLLHVLRELKCVVYWLSSATKPSWLTP